MENFLPFLQKHAGTTVVSELIKGLDLNNSTMSRYLNGERKMPVSVVIDLAEKYRFSILDGMVAAGFITEGQAEAEKSRYGLTTTSDKDLTNEVLRRLEAISPALLGEEEDSEEYLGEQNTFALAANPERRPEEDAQEADYF